MYYLERLALAKKRDCFTLNHKSDGGKSGVLLVNLGTPDTPEYWPVRRYLSQFLSDRRVIDLPGLLWKPILHGVVLPLRPFRSSAAYKKIWMHEHDESPLRWYTDQQVKKIRARMDPASDTVIEFAMRYGNPSIESKIEALRDQDCDRLCVIALFPQYSSTTTATIYDEVFRLLSRMRWQPPVRTGRPLIDHPTYIDCLCRSLKQGLDNLEFTPDRLILSFHGLPTSYIRKGDPYYTQCQRTTGEINKHHDDGHPAWTLAFQSRFGPVKWIEPHTSDVLKNLPGDGARNVVVAAPAFISDCIETLEELDIEYRELFMDHGGEHYAVLPCLNDSELAIHALQSIIENELSGWT